MWSGLESGVTLVNAALLRRCGVAVVLERLTLQHAETGEAPSPYAIPRHGAVVLRVQAGVMAGILRKFSIERNREYSPEAVRVVANVPFTDDAHERLSALFIIDDADILTPGVLVDDVESGVSHVFNLQQLIKSQPPGTVLREIFLKPAADQPNQTADLWHDIVKRNVLSWDAAEREAQLAHLLADDQFAQKVAFYRSIPLADRPPPLDFGCLKPGSSPAPAVSESVPCPVSSSPC